MAKILIIEDDDAVAGAIEFILEKNGHAPHRARTTLEASEKLATENWPLALIDVWLGEEDGLSFLSAERARGNMMPCIVISGGGPGKTLENVMARADALGASGMLYKPFEDTELMQEVNRALGQ